MNRYICGGVISGTVFGTANVGSWLVEPRVQERYRQRPMLGAGTLLLKTAVYGAAWPWGWYRWYKDPEAVVSL